MIWQVLLVIALMFPWWFAEATVIGTCCCGGPDCCKGCPQCADGTYPCEWNVDLSGFTNGTCNCEFWDAEVLPMSDDSGFCAVELTCCWIVTKHAGGGVFPSAFLYYESATNTWDIVVNMASCFDGALCLARYSLADASFNCCGENVFTFVAYEGDISNCCDPSPETLTATPVTPCECTE